MHDTRQEFELGTLDDLVSHHFWGARVVDRRTLESLRLRKCKLEDDAGGLAIRRTSEPLYRETTSSTNIEFPPGIAAAYLRAPERSEQGERTTL